MTISRLQASIPDASRPHPLPTVHSLRAEIDRVDDALLDLVEARVSLTMEMAALKHDDAGFLKLRPRREAEVLGRLTARARKADPAMIRHVWRTLMAYGLQDQAPMQLVLHADGGDVSDRLALQDRVRARFGPAAALRWAATRGEALDAARDTEAVAILAGSSAPADHDGLRLFETLESAGETGGCFAHAIGRVAAADLAPPEPRR